MFHVALLRGINVGGHNVGIRKTLGKEHRNESGAAPGIEYARFRGKGQGKIFQKILHAPLKPREGKEGIVDIGNFSVARPDRGTH